MAHCLRNDYHYELLRQRWSDLAKFAESMARDPSHIPNEPWPGDIKEVIKPLERLAQLVDPILEDTADYVHAHSGYDIHADYSRNQLSKAIDGLLLHEIGVAAEMVREEMQQAAE